MKNIIYDIENHFRNKYAPEPQDLTVKNYETIVDNKLQFGIINGENSSRHRIINNLPGTVDFCPLIHKTSLLTKFLQKDLTNKAKVDLQPIHKDLLRGQLPFSC